MKESNGLEKEGIGLIYFTREEFEKLKQVFTRSNTND